MDLQRTQLCVSNQPWHTMYIFSEITPGKVYEVKVPMPGDPPEDWTCTCPGWTHRGHCKHQLLVSPCLWKELEGPEEPTDEETCPRCGNDTYEELYVK